MTLADAPASLPDLLRLVAVPVFAWTAIRDVRTRRVSGAVWIPLGLLGAALLVWEGWFAPEAGGLVWTYEFLVPAAISLGFVVPIAYLFWWVGGFGGADAKALLVLAALFPTVPRYVVGSWTIPPAIPDHGAFSFTILTNAVLVGVAIPIALAVRNAVAGRITPAMFVGWPIDWDRVPTTHGTLLSTPTGVSRGGLDLDALRMYLRWRGLTLADVRERPSAYRDPASLPEAPNPPTDGAVDAGPDVRGDGGRAVEPDRASDRSDSTADPEHDDPWGAEAFLEGIDRSAYGTTPAELRGGLETLAGADRVWISPGMPFLVPVFLGLVIALAYGDLLIGTIG